MAPYVLTYVIKSTFYDQNDSIDHRINLHAGIYTSCFVLLYVSEVLTYLRKFLIVQSCYMLRGGL